MDDNEELDVIMPEQQDEEPVGKKKRKKKGGFGKGLLIGILATLLVVVVAGTLLLRALQYYGVTIAFGSGTASSSSTGQELSDEYTAIESKLSLLLKAIQTYYLDEDSVDEDAMVEGIYKGFIDALDEPYTVYYTKDEYEALQEDTSGKYSGIGVVMTQNVETGVISVVRPFEGSPGEEAGLLKDDVLYKVEGKTVTGEDLNNVVSWIKGEEGTTVEIEIYRESENKYITLEIERREIETPMVESEMLDNNIGYVEVAEFEETTMSQFDSAIDELESEGMQALIIDLRDNPGGLLSSATDLLDRILPEDKLLVYTEDKNGEKEEFYSEDDDEIDIPIVVLINGNSASASEIVSGCLQDYGTATLVGTTSFGKGIVQYVLPLGDGSALKLTSAKYYSPEGRNIHGTGIEPDVTVEQDDTTDADEQLDKAQEILLEEIGK